MKWHQMFSIKAETLILLEYASLATPQKECTASVIGWSRLPDLVEW